MQDPQIPQSIWYLTDANFVGFRVVRPLRDADGRRGHAVRARRVRASKEFIDYDKAQAGKQ